MIDYIEGLDPNKYDNHVFVIRVNVGQLCYTIYRSYSAFCELDARLRRKYPRCPIPVLPLAGGSLFTAKSPYSPSPSPSKKRAEDLRESMTTPEDSGYASDGGAIRNINRPAVKRKNKDEVIAQKKGPLNYYLQQLLALSEVLTCETFCHFIDPDPDHNYSDQNYSVSDDDSDVSQLDILLAGEKRISKLIIRKNIVSLEVKAGHVIVWSFETKNHDIGFSCYFNDTEIVQYQRYNSHLSPISSCFEVVENGELKLYFDNSYSKLRTKTITYVVKVFDKVEYHKASKLAIEVRKEKKLLSQQREFLKRALIKVANSNLIEGPQKLILLNFQDRDVINRAQNNDNNSSVLDLKDIATLEAEITRLKDEKTSLQKAMAQSESLLIQEKEQTKIQEEKVNDLYILNKSIIDEKTTLKSTIDDLKKEIDALKIKNVVNSSNAIITSRRESLDNSLLKYQFVIDDLQNKLNDAQTNNSLLETQLLQLKLEKKQLRNFAIQLKGQLGIRASNVAIEDTNKMDTNDNQNIDNKDRIDTNAEESNIYETNYNSDKYTLNNSESTILDSTESIEKETNDLEEDEDSSWRVVKATDPAPVDAKGVPIVTEVKRESLWF